MKTNILTKLSFFLLLLTLGTVNGWAKTTTYYYTGAVKTATGNTSQGSVYISTSEDATPSYVASMNTNTKNAWFGTETPKSISAYSKPSVTVYLFAKPATGYILEKWEGSNGETLYGEKTHANFDVSSESQRSPTIVTYTAHFQKEGVLRVFSDVGGAAYVDKINNDYPEKVTLTAYNLYDFVFTGWKHNGSIVSTEKTLQVDVPNLATGQHDDWTATFKKKTVTYYRLRNDNDMYLSIVGTQGSALGDDNNFGGVKLDGTIEFVPKENAITNPGTILKITHDEDGYNAGVYNNLVIEAQGINLTNVMLEGFEQVKKRVKDKGGNFSMTEKFSLSWNGKDGYKIRNADENYYIQSCGSETCGYFIPTTYSGANNDTWYLEPVDDEHIATNYFEVTADPNLDIVDNNGVTHHYCSLYVTFPFKCSTGMSAYYVTEIKDDVAECNTDGIQNVAANTPVILEWTGSNKIVPINIAENIPHAVESDAIDNNQWKGQIDLYTSKSNNTLVLNTVTYDQGKMRVLTAQELAGSKTVLLGKNTTLTKIPSNSAYLDYPNAREYYIVIFPLELIETEGEIKSINTKVGSVHVIRSFTGGTDGGWGNWNTFVVPFDMTLDDVEAQFGEAEVKELSSFFVTGEGDERTLHLRFSDATGIECGKPYMVRTKANVADLTMKDINVNTTKNPVQTLTSDDYTLDFQGLYVWLDGTSGNYVPRDAFIISNNLFYLVNSNVKMKGFRAYFMPEAKPAAKAPIRVMKFATEDKPTAIGTVSFDGLDDGPIYNTQGVRLNSMQRGINIVNGKKIIR